MNYLELFSGIGGFSESFKNLNLDTNFESTCVGYSEIDKYATSAYKVNFNTNNQIEIGDIVKFTNSKENIEKLPNFDLLVGGFPCQSFSMMGNEQGFADNRGNLFFNIIDILQVKKPKFVLLENVKNLITHDKGETLKTILKNLSNLGYHVYYDVFNTTDYNLAQVRNRVFIFATLNELSIPFNNQVIKENFKKIIDSSSLLNQKDVSDVLNLSVDSKYYLSDKFKPTILSNGTKDFIGKSEINQMIARPLTASMVKMHRACQDNYYSEGFLLSENKEEYLKQYFTKEELALQHIRKLTPKECLNLQGFNDKFYENLRLIRLSDFQIYKQSGNAVSVNVVYAILYYLFIKNRLK